MNQYKINLNKTFFSDDPSPASCFLNRSIICLVLFGLIITAVETEPLIAKDHGPLLRSLEVFISITFALEYVVRVWCYTFEKGWKGVKERFKYILSAGALIDLMAFLPSLLTVGVSDAFILRILRLARLARFARLGRYSTAMNIVKEALDSHWRELAVSVALSICLLFVSATLLYFVEGGSQPENFGSIPRALWWSVVTLTTVGYGDVYPVTALGKICAGIIAFVGVGTVALPTGILAAAFSETYKRRSSRREETWDSGSERASK